MHAKMLYSCSSRFPLGSSANQVHIVLQRILDGIATVLPHMLESDCSVAIAVVCGSKMGHGGAVEIGVVGRVTRAILH